MWGTTKNRVNLVLKNNLRIAVVQLVIRSKKLIHTKTFSTVHFELLLWFYTPTFHIYKRSNKEAIQNWERTNHILCWKVVTGEEDKKQIEWCFIQNKYYLWVKEEPSSKVDASNTSVRSNYYILQISFVWILLRWQEKLNNFKNIWPILF